MKTNITQKCKCGGTLIRRKNEKLFYCNKCFKHFRKLRTGPLKRVTHNQSALDSYYRRLGCDKGYLTIKQAATFKKCSIIDINDWLCLFDIKIINKRKVIEYNAKFINWDYENYKTKKKEFEEHWGMPKLEAKLPEMTHRYNGVLLGLPFSFMMADPQIKTENISEDKMRVIISQHFSIDFPQA